MRVIPLSFCPTLSEDEIYRHECSDRIWVPRHMFERWLTAEDAGSVVIVKLDEVPACMYAPHAGDRDIIYAPVWMCEELGVSLDSPMETEDSDTDDFIVPERLQPPMCTFLRVQPHTSDHLPTRVGGSGGEEMPEDTLSRAFEEYTCLRQDQTVLLNLPSGNRMFVTIVDTDPRGGPVCIRNTEIAMDLLEPLEPLEPLYLPRVPTPPPEPLPILLPNTPSPTPQEESYQLKRARMLAAAMARMHAASESLSSLPP